MRKMCLFHSHTFVGKATPIYRLMGSIGDVKCSNDARTSRVFSGKFKCDFDFFLALFGIIIDYNNFVLSICPRIERDFVVCGEFSTQSKVF